ncbi:uncharacterized protein LOC141720624 isoform X2 [Apium graveolens]|uniref:uncharacterized protein LOC141720624 isoform X2 n=1 Tax=Apium graveolens TaxID=4045 RepID=UPI003D78D58C
MEMKLIYHQYLTLLIACDVLHLGDSSRVSNDSISLHLVTSSGDESSSAGKLNDVENTILGKFGMSADNFKAVQDPNQTQVLGSTAQKLFSWLTTSENLISII